ncbi:MAG: OadG family protein [Clostridia bacterium]|nr:OadG family protein [Clostridia bacterium]
MMTQFVLAQALPWSERASTAGTVTLLGMVTIFLVLALLWGVIEVMHCLMPKEGGSKEKKAKEKPAKKEKKKTAPVPNEQDAAIAAAIAASLAAYEDSGATVAAITAAITAARADSGETGGFRVVSFKRTAGSARCRRF